MKQKIKIFLIIWGLLFTGLQFVAPVSTVHAAALTAQQCFDTYDGHGSAPGLSKSNTMSSKDFTTYAKSGCDDTATSGAQNCHTNSSSQGAVINCTAPEGAGNTGAGADPNAKTCDSSNGLANSTVDNTCIIAGTGDPALKGCDKAGSCDIIHKYVNPAIEVFSAIAGIVVAIAIVYGGILYSMAGGDSGKVSKAKSLIRNAVLSLVAYIFLWAFLQWLIPGGLFH